MVHRRRVSLTREGWYYLVVMAFVIGGAVLREVNLLLVLSAMMVGPVILGWRLALATIGDLEVRRRLPNRCHAGDTVQVELSVTNARSRMSSWALVVQDSLAAEGHAAQGGFSVLFSHVGPREQVARSYQLSVGQRGRFQLGPARVATRFPFGLVQVETDLPGNAPLIVAPRLGRLTKSWRRIVGKTRRGRQVSHHRRGMLEGDYYGLREWRPGDNRRWIHWRSSARVGGLAIMQFEDQSEEDLLLMAELWLPPEPTNADLERLETTLSFLATVVVDICRQPGRTLRLGVAGSKSYSWNAPSSPGLCQEVLDELAVVQGAAEPDLTAACRAFPPASAGARRIVGITSREGTRGLPAPVHSLALDESSARGRDVAPLWLGVGGDELAEYYVAPGSES